MLGKQGAQVLKGGAEIRAALRPIGEDLDGALRALTAWRRDLGSTLYALLACFEDLTRLPVWWALTSRNVGTLLKSDHDRQRFEAALTVLVATAYRCCQPGCADRLADEQAYGEALEALRFGAEYRDAIWEFEEALNGRRTVVVDGRRLRFSFAIDEEIDQEARALFALVFTEVQRGATQHPWIVPALFGSPEGEDIARVIASATRLIDHDAIAYTVPPEVDALFAALAEQRCQPAELPPQVQVGGYTLEQYAAAYRYLFKRAALHQCFCWFSSRVGARGWGVASLPLVFTREALMADLRAAGLPSEAAACIVRDLTYDPKLAHTDVFFQPLLPIDADRFVASPMAITASRWERNLQRLWALKHRDEFGARIGSERGRLARNVAEAFAGRGFVASVNRPLALPGDPTVTDADVAVFDAGSNTLLVIEVKWLIRAAESREVRRNDAELAHGIAQVQTAAGFVRQHAVAAGGLLFPDYGVEIRPDTAVRAAVVSRNHVGPESILTSEVLVLDYDLLIAHLAKPVQQPLTEALDAVDAMFRTPQRGLQFERHQTRYELAGYTVKGPGYRLMSPPGALDPPPGALARKIGRNDPCPCGSGRKYKRCHGR